MIKLENVSFKYKKRTVTDSISMTLECGEICSVIGANGSGKTTLLRLISRLLTPQSGNIEIDGKNIGEYSTKEYAKKVSLLPQSRPIPAVTVYDYVAGGRYPYLGFSGKLSVKDTDAVEKAVSLTGIHFLIDKKLTELSGGERQRVYFAQILAQDTPYVLLDEPGTHLDIMNLAETENLMSALRERGKGIISVSHDLSSAIKNSDRILVLEDGKAMFFGTPREAIDKGITEAVFGVRCYEQTVDGETEYFFRRIK